MEKSCIEMLPSKTDYSSLPVHMMKLFWISYPMIQEELIMKYICDICGWAYDEEQGCPESGIAPGTKFEDLPDDFLCPLCFVRKDLFSQA